MSAWARSYSSHQPFATIADTISGLLAPACGSAALVYALVLSGLYQTLVFSVSGKYPIVNAGYAVAYAAIAGVLLAVALPGRMAITSITAATWTVWFTNSGVFEIWKADSFLRLLSILALAALPMWALRTEERAPAVRQEYIPTLEGWRAIAILLVLADHAMVEIASHSATLNNLRFGQHGVNLFFALSGYLITTRLLNEKAQTGRVSLRRFYRRRAFRILPAVLPALALIGTLSCAGVVKVRAIEIAS